MSIYYAFYANNNYELPICLKALNWLVIMFTIYGLVYLLFGKEYVVNESDVIGKTLYLKSIYKSLLPIYAFYVFAKKGLLTEQIMKTWFFVFLILTIHSYFQVQTIMMELLTRDEYVNNVGYSFIGLLPAIILFKNKPIIQYLLLSVCLFFIMMSMKRGAILIGVICLLWFVFNNTKKAKGKRKWTIAVVSIVIIIIGYYFYNYRMENSAEFRYRISQTFEGDSSGRDALYNTFLNHFLQEQNPFRFLFGYGANGTILLGGNYAHNDWLEIITNQGILGFVIHLVYWVTLIVFWKKIKRNPQAFMAIGLFIIVYLFSSFFSMSYNCVTRCAAMILGYYLATYEMVPDNSEVELIQRKK